MRLLQTATLRFVDVASIDGIQFAILSHTWGEDEVSYQEMQLQPDSMRTKAGYNKIEQFCKVAEADGFQLAWVDTCCIDKSSSAELSEAINSMYEWYARAHRCYVYLADLSVPPSRMWEGAAQDGYHDRTIRKPVLELIRKCRWFARGWTLQELLAPIDVAFFNCRWEHIGSKRDLSVVIANMTGLPALLIEFPDFQHQYSIASMMSWAAHRQTTRKEDAAYSLLGLFKVNMGLIYGEGTNAFRRLQEDVIKRSNDLTIFAWDDQILRTGYIPDVSPSSFILFDRAEGSNAYSDTPATGDLFATSPAFFQNAGQIIHDDSQNMDFSLTNKGLRFSGPVVLFKHFLEPPGISHREFVATYSLRLGENRETHGSCALHLRKIGPRLYYRDSRWPCSLKQALTIGGQQTEIVTDPYIVTQFSIAHQEMLFNHRNHFDGVIRVPQTHYRFKGAVPESLWDYQDCCFMVPPNLTHDVVLALKLERLIDNEPQEFLFLCTFYLKPHARYYICLTRRHRAIADMLFDLEHRENSVRRSELLRHAPEFAELTSTCTLPAVDGLHEVRCRFDRQEMPVGPSRTVSCRDLIIEVVKREY